MDGLALETTTRVVYEQNNLNLNKQLINYLFTKYDGEYLRLGDILKESKNQLKGDGNRLNYILLGDPALKLNYPKSTVELQTINGESADSKKFEFKALDQIILQGVIKDPSGNVDANFNGPLRGTAFNGLDSVYTYVKDDSKPPKPYGYTDYPGTAFPVNGTVKNGVFTVSVTVPLDIAYSDKIGKISLYASDDSRNNEAKGFFQNYILNGTSEEVTTDTLGPEIISMYLNTPTFQQGDAVNATPYFFAEVFDRSGINVSGGMGHNITISIDNVPVSTYSLNSYFQERTDIKGQGTIGYSIPTLSAGFHRLYFRVWDSLNNSTLDSLSFYVDPGLQPQMFDLQAIPNPAREYTSFMIVHDRPDTPLEISIAVYDISGRRIWQYQNNNLSEPVEWNLTSAGGGKVKPGVYIYRATIKTSGSESTTDAKKIIVLGQ